MHASSRPRGKQWDIFCAVVDNYGDIGVCWRLARQLAAEHALQLRLWVDDLASFQRLCPELDPALTQQTVCGIDIRRWEGDFAAGEALQPAEVVIEAFGCPLPERYLAAMAAAPRKPVWINLEYLSAESWISGCHGLSSPHPQRPLTKHFFFPGFTPETGGVLREARLLQQRDEWSAQRAPRWDQLGIPAAATNELTLSLFCYENPLLPELLDIWSGSPDPLRCLVPEGRASTQIASWLKQRGQTASLQAGTGLQIGSLRLHVLPFVRQEAYDHLLWSCDINFVRGEDSFVRAQWAAHPCVWHIYPQAEAAHHAKLEAFLDLYCVGLDADDAAALRAFWRLWNGIADVGNTQRPRTLTDLWSDFLQRRPALMLHAERWSNYLTTQEDLASRLVRFGDKLL